MDEGDLESISQVAEKLKGLRLPTVIAEQFDRLSDLVDGFDYAEAIELAGSMQSEIK